MTIKSPDDLLEQQAFPHRNAAEGDGLSEQDELSAIKADMASVRLFLGQLAKDEHWTERANSMLALTRNWEAAEIKTSEELTLNLDDFYNYSRA